jgi:hypothetical protein
MSIDTQSKTLKSKPPTFFILANFNKYRFFTTFSQKAVAIQRAV